MSSINSSLWTKIVAIGVVAVAAVIGNASLSFGKAASLRNDPPAMPPSSGSAGISIADRSMLAGGAFSGFGYSRLDFSKTGGDGSAVPPSPAQISEASVSNESGQVVPAIYAWDPDVRYVFYRHVSKWM